jgi:hypothetical protein
MCAMLIALLAVLGVDLIVIVVLLATVLTRRYWISHQAGAFKGAVRVAAGDVPGLRVKWMRGYGRWVRDVLVWTKAPFLFRNEFVAADALAGEARAARPGEVKRLGKKPAVILLAVVGGARVEIATTEAGRALAAGPVPAAAASADGQVGRATST